MLRTPSPALIDPDQCLTAPICVSLNSAPLPCPAFALRLPCVCRALRPDLSACVPGQSPAHPPGPPHASAGPATPPPQYAASAAAAAAAAAGSDAGGESDRNVQGCESSYVTCPREQQAQARAAAAAAALFSHAPWHY